MNIKNKLVRFSRTKSSCNTSIEFVLRFIISKYKRVYFSYVFTKEDWSWFEFLISWTRRIDNAGLDIYLEILWFSFRFSLQDARLWDHDNKCWESAIESVGKLKDINYEWF